MILFHLAPHNWQLKLQFSLAMGTQRWLCFAPEKAQSRERWQEALSYSVTVFSRSHCCFSMLLDSPPTHMFLRTETKVWTREKRKTRVYMYNVHWKLFALAIVLAAGRTTLPSWAFLSLAGGALTWQWGEGVCGFHGWDSPINNRVTTIPHGMEDLSRCVVTEKWLITILLLC